MGPQGSAFDLAVEIGRLVGLAHPYKTTGNRDCLVMDYLMRNRAIHRHLLTANASTATGTVRAIKEYLVVGSSNLPTCKVVGEETESIQLAQLVATLTTQLEVITKMLARMDILEQSLKGPSAMHSYCRLINQPGPGKAQTPVARKPLALCLEVYT